jgi:hypothetical protein
VRDFSASDAERAARRARGKYLAFTEANASKA